MHYIKNLDRHHFVCMRDVEEDHVLFAVDYEQCRIYTELVSRYDCEPAQVPASYTMEVIRLTEVEEYVFAMTNTMTLRYPVNHLDFALTLPCPGSETDA